VTTLLEVIVAISSTIGIVCLSLALVMKLAEMGCEIVMYLQRRRAGAQRGGANDGG
jgi:hypothetical protein